MAHVVSPAKISETVCLEACPTCPVKGLPIEARQAVGHLLVTAAEYFGKTRPITQKEHIKRFEAAKDALRVTGADDSSLLVTERVISATGMVITLECDNTALYIDKLGGE